MTVFAIDPGPIESAFVLWDGDAILDKGKLANRRVCELIHTLKFDVHVWIEMIASYGMPVGAEVFETCVWIGRFAEISDYRFDHRAKFLKRKEIVLHLCDSPRANDSNVRQALLDRVGPQGTKKAPGPTYGVRKDVWSALAVAVTAYDKLTEQHP